MKYLKGWESFNESSENPQKFDYMMLGRLQTDCDYFLGHGNRSERNLYYGNVPEHIQAMKDLWNKLEAKPEWLTMEEIEKYEKEMMGDTSDMDMDMDMDMDNPTGSCENPSCRKYIYHGGDYCDDDCRNYNIRENKKINEGVEIEEDFILLEFSDMTHKDGNNLCLSTEVDAPQDTLVKKALDNLGVEYDMEEVFNGVPFNEYSIHMDELRKVKNIIPKTYNKWFEFS
jgi:hypothetical protein